MVDDTDVDVEVDDRNVDVESLSPDELRVLVGHLQRAVTSHGVVGQAIGVLVAAHRFPPDQAWSLLRRTSQNANIKVNRLARSVVEVAAGLPPTDQTCCEVVCAALLPSAEPTIPGGLDNGVKGEIPKAG